MDNKQFVPDEALKQIDKLDKQVKNLTSSLKKLDSQTDALYKTFSKSSTSLKDLSAAVDKYTKVEKAVSAIEKERKKTLEEIETRQTKLNTAYSDEARELEKLKQLNSDVIALKKDLSKTRESEEKNIAKERAELEKLNQVYDTLNKSTKDSDFGRQLKSEIQEATTGLAALEKGTGQGKKNVTDYEDTILGALGLNSNFLKSVINLGKNTGEGGSSIKAFFSNMGDSVKAFGNTLSGLLKNPVFLTIAGIKAAGSAFKFWYEYNEGLVKATRLTKQFTGFEGNDLKAYRNEVLAVAETFDADFNEVLRTANALSTQFGISSKDAITLIGDGFIAGADANGKYLDILKEYPAHFNEAGISADQFIAIVAQTENMGLFSDKGIDAIKTGNTKLRELTQSTRDALDGIGISSKQVGEDLRNGTKTTFDVMQEVSEKLAELPPQSIEAGNAIATIFGEEGKAAGYEFLSNLYQINTNLDDAKAKTGELGEIQERQLKANIDLQNAVSALFDQTGGTFESMTGSAKAFATESLASIVKGLISIVNYFIDIYNKSLMIRVGIASVATLFQVLFEVAQTGFNAVIDSIKNMGRSLKALVTLDFDALNNTMKFTTDFSGLGEKIKKTIKENAEQAATGQLGHIEIPVKLGTIYKTAEENKTDNNTNKNNNKTGGIGNLKSAIDEEAKAAQELEKLHIETQKKTLSDNKKSYEERINALNTFIEAQENAVKEQKQTQLDELRSQFESEAAYKNEAQNRIQLIESKAQAELDKIKEDGEKFRFDITKGYAEEQIKVISDAMSERTNTILENEQKNREELARQYAEGLLTNEQYESRKKQLTVESQKEIFENQIAFLNEQLNLEKLNADQQEKIREQLSKAEIDYAKYTSEQIVTVEDEAGKKREEIEKKLAEKRKELVAQSLDFISTLYSAYTDKRLAELEKESEEINKTREKQERESEKQTEKELEALYERQATEMLSEEEVSAGRTRIKEQEDARKALIEQQAEERETQIEERRIELQQRQAEFEKAMSIMKITINTAAAVMAAWTNPFTAPFIIPSIIASGAIQLATVLAASTPQYAKGTEDASGGLSWLGDGGKHEMIITPDGKMYKTPNTPTLMDLPAHSIVKPDFEKALMEAATLFMPDYKDEPQTIIVEENAKMLNQGRETIKILNRLLIGQNKERGNQMYLIQQERLNNKLNNKAIR